MNNPSKTFEMLRLYPWLSSDPISGREGEFYYNITTQSLRVCTGGVPLWKDVGGSQQWLDSGSDIYFNTGNVGIGTSTPDTKLHVQSAIKIDGDTNPYLILNDGTFNAYLQIAAGQFDLRTTTANPISFATNGIERAIIASSGNVGIGTSVPDQKLEIGFGSVLIQAWDSVINPIKKGLFFRQGFGPDHPTNPYNLGIIIDEVDFARDGGMTLSSFDGIRFLTASDTGENERMRIGFNGNIGIGTITPTEKLHIAGSIRIVDGTEAAGYVLTSDANGVGSWAAAGGGSQWIDSGLNIYYDLGRVNVGGTDFSGSSKFIVETAQPTGTSAVKIADFGGAYIAMSNDFDGSTSGTKQGIFFSTAGAAGILSGIAGIRKNNADWQTELAFYVNNITSGPDGTGAIQERMRLDSNGFLGVGTVAPAYTVDVAGDVNVTGNFKVNGVNFSSGIANLVEDTSPQLGGDLDMNNYSVQLDTSDIFRVKSSTMISNRKIVETFVNAGATTVVATVPVYTAGENIGTEITLRTAGNGSTGNKISKWLLVCTTTDTNPQLTNFASLASSESTLNYTLSAAINGSNIEITIDNSAGPQLLFVKMILDYTTN